MPTPPPFEKINFGISCRISGHWKSSLGRAQNLLTVGSTDILPDLTEVSTAVDVVATWCSGEYNSMISEDWTIDDVYGFSAAEETGPFFAEVVGVPGEEHGTTGAIGDPAWAPLAMLHGTVRARYNAGRFYAFAPAAAVENVTDTDYTPAQRLMLVNALETLQGSLGSAGLYLAIGSRSHQTAYLVNSITTSDLLTLQTRRRVGVGG